MVIKGKEEKLKVREREGVTTKKERERRERGCVVGRTNQVPIVPCAQSPTSKEENEQKKGRIALKSPD